MTLLNRLMSFYSRQEAFRFHLLEQQWCRQSSLGFHAFTATIELSGFKVHGAGSDPDRSKALLKTLMELTERSIFHLKSVDPIAANGFSLHRSFADAATHASFELIERDLFLCHYLTQTPFPDITDRALERSELFRTVHAFFANHGVSLHLGAPLMREGLNVVVAASFGPEDGFGCVVGAACRRDLVEALEKALLEILGTTYLAATGGINAIDGAEFHRLTKTSVENHLRLALHRESAPYLLQLFERDAPILASHVSNLFEGMHLAEVPIPEPFDELPVFACKASHSGLQRMAFCRPLAAYCNRQRLSEFKGHQIGLEDLLGYPHPFS